MPLSVPSTSTVTAPPAFGTFLIELPQLQPGGDRLEHVFLPVEGGRVGKTRDEVDAVVARAARRYLDDTGCATRRLTTLKPNLRDPPAIARTMSGWEPFSPRRHRAFSWWTIPLFTRTLLADELRQSGFIVDAAASVEEALSILVVHHPDVVIVDVYLDNGPSGVDLAQTLREDPATAFTFVIALSGHYAPECLQLALDAGCDRFFVKPCPTVLLVETIEDFLSNRAGAATG